MASVVLFMFRNPVVDCRAILFRGMDLRPFFADVSTCDEERTSDQKLFFLQ